jgi:hypothetical protein
MSSFAPVRIPKLIFVNYPTETFSQEDPQVCWRRLLVVVDPQNFATFPEKVLVKILLNLSFIDAVHLCQTCSRLSKFLSDWQIWIWKAQHDFAINKTEFMNTTLQSPIYRYWQFINFPDLARPQPRYSKHRIMARYLQGSRNSSWSQENSSYSSYSSSYSSHDDFSIFWDNRHDPYSLR